jgi:hypothetical protein
MRIILLSIIHTSPRTGVFFTTVSHSQRYRVGLMLANTSQSGHALGCVIRYPGSDLDSYTDPTSDALQSSQQSLLRVSIRPPNKIPVIIFTDSSGDTVRVYNPAPQASTLAFQDGQLDMDTHDNYVYQALEQPEKVIRLLGILSVSRHICYELIVVPSDDLPSYTTLSYVWGDSNGKECVVIEGKKLEITSNSANALRDIYGQLKSCPVDVSAEQWLWADGICINQADSYEKNHHVPLME